MRIPLAVVMLILALALPAQAVPDRGPSGPSFPPELQGVWDVHPWPCVAAVQSDSDMRFLIEGGRRRNHEDDDTLVSMEEIAVAPRAWRISSTSSLDPEQSRIDARIYVLAGDRLTVADDGRTEVYIRCK